MFHAGRSRLTTAQADGHLAVLRTLARLSFERKQLDKAGAYLRPRLALKGGTAINLFHLEIPRLSVDIDLNYIGAVDRETMLTERPKVEQAACGTEPGRWLRKTIDSSAAWCEM